MNRRALILNELGLNPVWVRHEVLAQLEAEAEHADVAQPQVAIENTPPAPNPNFSPIAQAAHQRMEETIEAAPATPSKVAKAPSQEAAAIHQVLKARNTPAALRPVEVAVAAPAELDERTQAILQMDWQRLQEAVKNCTACKLCETRSQAVFGVGDAQAQLVVVGEAPGADEDAQGEPFVGKAGKLLDNMLASIGQQRGDKVFIANVLKCRPPGNRNPQPDEVAQCAPFLQRQIELIAPKVLFASGRFAIQRLLNDDAPISALRGKIHHYRQTPVVVSYHPAYLLRNMPDKAKAWQDLLLLKTQLDK
ncbi:uracil-DNA glycosylase [Chitinibacter bivalviorum]|uniref:Type-4 uracil-DNA glycosylase n=1 Tax=Chitinibacter bivalviorum TaxID=2739434 RepID=A0A7H9BFY0_9NEIS|nr:uracil-DNA glycosylase [Chitinibacter bivalviorum]QLG87108.1 uracil-DNA glycosylase [Chitinibacter bivalviorum]